MAFIPAIFKKGLTSSEVARALIVATVDCGMSSPSNANFNYSSLNRDGVTWTQSGRHGGVSANSGTNYLSTITANKGGKYAVMLRKSGRYSSSTMTASYAQVRIDGGSWTDASNTVYTANSSFAMRVGNASTPKTS